MTTREIAEKLYKALNSHTNCYYQYKDLYVKTREAFESAIDELIRPRMAAAAVIDRDGTRWERMSDGRWIVYRIGFGKTIDSLQDICGPLTPAPNAPAPPELGDIQRGQLIALPEQPTLRDMFAIAAANRMLKNNESIDRAADDCYAFASAMMKARGQ